MRQAMWLLPLTLSLAAASAGWAVSFFELHQLRTEAEPELKPLAPLREPRIKMLASPAVVKRPFTVTAYVKDHAPCQMLRIILPPGVDLVPGERFQKPVPASGEKGYATVSWRLQTSDCGDYPLFADLEGITSDATVYVRPPSCSGIFD